MTAISVIICSHNPRLDYIIRTIDGLKRQDLPHTQWELVLVDNNCADRLAHRIDLSWHPRSKHAFEPELGLATARRRGMNEASGDLLVFVDDDNVLSPNYLSEVTRIDKNWPALGVWGSCSIVGEFEGAVPSHVSKYVDYLAIREFSSPRWSNRFSRDVTPIGAGICIRASVGKAYQEMVNRSAINIVGRKGASLTGAEDYEICIVACNQGYGIAQFPTLKITHLISAERIEDKYFLRLMQGSKFSNALLEFKWAGIIPRSPRSARALLSFCKNILILRGFERRMYLAGLRGEIQAYREIKSLGAARGSHR